MKRPEPFWVVGHRGSPTIEVENTLPSFRRAVEREGANGVELDLSVTRDDNVVLWHDFAHDEWRARFRRWGLEPDVRFRPVISESVKAHRTTADLELSELRESYGYAEKKSNGARADAEIPTIEAFMDWAVDRPELGIVFLDIKVTGNALELLPIVLRRVDACVSRLQPRFRIIYESAYPAVIERLAHLAPHCERTLDVEPHAGLVWDTSAHSAARAAIRYQHSCATSQKPRGITLWPFRTHRQIIEADLERVRTHNERAQGTPVDCVCSFTINDEREMAELIRLGVSAIQSDRPELLTRVARQCGRSIGCEPRASNAARAPGR